VEALSDFRMFLPKRYALQTDQGAPKCAYTPLRSERRLQSLALRNGENLADPLWSAIEYLPAYNHGS
jgi:hypothetical protein